MTKTETSSSRPIKKSELKKKKMKAAAATTPIVFNWAAGDVVEAGRGGGSKNWSLWQLATVWGPAARSGHYWLRFLKSSEVVCIPASRIRMPKLDCACRIRDADLEAILMHVGCEHNYAARREEEEEEEDDAQSVSSSVGSNEGWSSESENDCSIHSSDESEQRAETAYRFRRAAYMSGMIEIID